jgi:hypothetical protein
MRQAHVPFAKVQDVLRRFQEHQRLIELVRTMSQEIERLNEDNTQLRAAVSFYRETVRQCNIQAPGYPAPVRGLDLSEPPVR